MSTYINIGNTFPVPVSKGLAIIYWAILLPLATVNWAPTLCWALGQLLDLDDPIQSAPRREIQLPYFAVYNMLLWKNVKPRF